MMFSINEKRHENFIIAGVMALNIQYNVTDLKLKTLLKVQPFYLKR